MKDRALLWFTRDLRVQDNPMFHWAAKNDCDVIGLAFEPLEASRISIGNFCGANILGAHRSG